MTFAQLREQIDAIDDQLLRLLSRRARLAIRVGRVKKRQHKRVFDPPREREVLRRMTAANRGPLSRRAVARIFREIVTQHRRLAQRASSHS